MLSRILTAVVLACALFFATKSLGLTSSKAGLVALVPIVSLLLNVLVVPVIAGSALTSLFALMVYVVPVPQAMMSALQSIFSGGEVHPITSVQTHQITPEMELKGTGQSDALIGKLNALDIACRTGALDAQACNQARANLLRRELRDGTESTR